MTLSDTATAQLLETLRASGGAELIREAVELVLRELIEAEATAVISPPDLHSESRPSCHDSEWKPSAGWVTVRPRCSAVVNSRTRSCTARLSCRSSTVSLTRLPNGSLIARMYGDA